MHQYTDSSRLNYTEVEIEYRLASITAIATTGAIAIRSPGNNIQTVGTVGTVGTLLGDVWAVFWLNYTAGILYFLINLTIILILPLRTLSV